jgi:hypothetical protein
LSAGMNRMKMTVIPKNSSISMSAVVWYHNLAPIIEY